MSSDNEDKRVFEVIRPYCVQLSQVALAPIGVFDPNSSQVVESLRELYSHFRECVNESTILSTNLADYVFLPLSYLLKQPKLGDTATTYLLRILGLIIEHCWSSPGSLPYVLAKQLFPLVTFLCGGSPNPNDRSDIVSKSDTLKLAGSLALEQFFKALVVQRDSKIYDFFSNTETLPPLGHAVTVLLEFAHSGKEVELQLQALTTLDVLYFDMINDGEILSYILPGNVSTLTKIIAGTGKTHYTVISKSLMILRKLLVLVYNDDDLNMNYKPVEAIQDIFEESDLNQIALTEEGFRKIHRTGSWLKATSAQVKLALTSVLKIHTHQKDEVQHALELLGQGIINNCLLSLNSSVPIAVEMLAYSSQNMRTPVALKEQTDPKIRGMFQDVMSKELNKYVDSFESVIASPNEDKIIKTIGAIRFIVKMEPNGIAISKLIKLCIQELSDSLTKAQAKTKVIPTSSASELSDLMLITKDATSLEVSTGTLNVLGKVLTNNVQDQLASLIQTIGSSNPSEIIEDIISYSYNGTLNERAVGLWIINNLMSGYKNKIGYTSIANEYLSLEDDDSENQMVLASDFVYSVLEYSKSILDETSEMEITDAVVLATNVSLDSVFIIQSMLKQNFRDELIDYIYPVIESMASPSEIVREHALRTSMGIAQELYSGSLYDMILDNADYLVDSVSIRLSNAMTTRTTAILAVCLKIAGFKIIETFKDVMEIMFNLLDHYHGYDDMCIGFFVLFEIVVDEISKKYLSESGLHKLELQDSTSTYKPWGMTNIMQVASLLSKDERDIEHLKYVKPLEDDDVEDEIDNLGDSDDEDEEPSIPDVKKEWASPVPEDAYRLLQQVSYYGERLLSHPSTKLRLQILRVLNKSIVVFATAPDNLFPIVASIWQIVASSVNSNDPRVVILASEVISKIVEYSGTFVTTRFLDLWQNLKENELLVTAAKQATESKKIVLPGINQSCYNSLVEMIVMSLNKLGRTIPDSTTEEMVRSCIGVVPVEKFDSHSDVAWLLKKNIYGVKDVKHPHDVIIDGETFKFIEV
ncbi:Tti1p CYBJADRAFT_138505 [Cyberlindnera jadinii NRRL Y-1542]|uniref:TEL2-interacting protein 1 n=1 Tax=Cyberlindnera jadinii (strain ATCC 18201 / CBS 1600 / BCRC 20928 / JCM 3617 / NBRC 0987 / NRRL Y-1542) TaxID=983966 RepID=A0A1E4S368_CYBJN|nr:hypothetical protein CYBJADRAFT_138505 [Cyberlindnera jadinii NRRL Y-1542]ODV73951.1 hypothetical protein CYBJADRAFT_138505 [Cyberlindnera jadinii NRRL Y-1542]